MKKIEINFLEVIHKGYGYEKNIISLRFIFFYIPNILLHRFSRLFYYDPNYYQSRGFIYSSKKIPVSYLGIGSSFGIENAKKGGLGVISRYLTPQEKKEGLIAIPIAYTSYVFIINKSNPIRNLSMEQLYKIYAGTYQNWKDVGGSDHNIVIFWTNNSHGSYFALLESFRLEKYPKNFTSYQVYRKILLQIFHLDGGIGYVGKDLANKLSIEIPVKTLKINSPKSLNENNLNSKKLFIRKMSFVMRLGSINDEMRNFIKFFYSKEAIHIIKDEGFSPIPLDKSKYSFLNSKI